MNQPAPAPLCTYIKTDGVRCGSPAVKGSELCFHHSAVKTALGKVKPQAASGEFAPIPFVFPEDRASMQINFFLLLQAFNEGRIDLRTFNAMQRLLCSMARNLGKTGSLVNEPSDQQSVTSKPTSQKRDVKYPCTREQEDGEQDAASEYPVEFSPELMAKFEEIERLDTNDPSYADRIRAAVAEGTKELKARGIDLMEIPPVAGSLPR